jgi:GTP cyclohydrolase II
MKHTPNMKKPYEEDEEFYRFNLIQKLSKKYAIRLNKLIEVLFDAEISRKEITKDISISGKNYNVKKIGIGPIVTPYGRFYQITFEINDKWKNYYVIAKAGLDKKTMLPIFDNAKPIFLRIDSGCSTGQLFGDLTCDCKEQLNLAMKVLGETEQGLIVHIPHQDGRGKGIDFKLATLYLQEQLGVDTTESFALLERDSSIHGMDSRDYEGAIAILRFLGATSNILMGTNNPKKLAALQSNKIKIIKPKPMVICPTKFTLHHLKAKKEILGHNCLEV